MKRRSSRSGVTSRRAGKHGYTFDEVCWGEGCGDIEKAVSLRGSGKVDG